ncbi:hypothetical protein FHR97_000566 [Halomonas stenophila]|uniref:Sulfotransferase domain-containing protein n=1 Tax=Halomonas stenophila TaxID=795312 RepID=A0A7W5HJS5_9GAMM|nr:hypothetical protein [Halomonas stenophila]
MAAKDKSFFIEKTPRNLFVAKDIMSIYGNGAKYLCLVRNPAAIACSMISTWGKGRWNIYAFEQDFMLGIDCMIKVMSKDACLSIKYEDLLSFEDQETERVSRYLGIGLSELKDKKIEVIEGRMGDPVGQYKYSKIEKTRSSEWKKTINTFTKVAMLKSLIRRIGNDKLEKLGYSYAEVLESIKIHGKYSARDEVFDASLVVYGVLYKIFQPFILKEVIVNKLRFALR